MTSPSRQIILAIMVSLAAAVLLPLAQAQRGGGGSVSVSPSSLSFGRQVVGLADTPQTVTVRNNRNSSINVTSVSTSLGDYLDTHTCGTLARNATCTITVTFTPAATGSRNATLDIATSS